MKYLCMNKNISPSFDLEEGQIQVKNRHKQQGVALVISLIFLVLITLIGVSSIRGTTMNEMISANLQQKSSTYQVSESVIESLWSIETIMEHTPAQIIDPPLKEVLQVTGREPFDALFDTETASSSHAASAKADFSAKATIQYCYEGHNGLDHSRNSDLTASPNVEHYYSIHGMTTLSATGASANHDQRGSISKPAVGRTGNCP